jgi:hypothetical protein
MPATSNDGRMLQFGWSGVERHDAGRPPASYSALLNNLSTKAQRTAQSRSRRTC